MNIANVTKRFASLSGFDGEQISKYRFLIEDACNVIQSRCKKAELNDGDLGRLETLCAVYALRLTSMCNDENISSFTAGDVKITSSAASGKYDRFWQELLAKSQDLIRQDGFLFGRVM